MSLLLEQGRVHGVNELGGHKQEPFLSLSCLQCSAQYLAHGRGFLEKVLEVN